MTNTTLITGVTGFVGSHLLDRLADSDRDLYGVVRESSSLEYCRDHRADIDLRTCNLVDGPAVFELLEDVAPDHIYHLAGQSSVKSSWDSTYSLINNNIVATLNILEGVRQAESIDPRVLLACSSEQYGLVDADALPVTESMALNPVSPYAVSKSAVDMFGFQYYKSHGVKTIRTRAFNHTGPRRPDKYALSDFAKQIVEIENEMSDSNHIHVGNLSAVRDYTDVRDVVKAYELAMCECSSGEAYNICSMTGYTIRELLDRLIELSGEDITVVQEDERIRPVDVPELVGDCAKFEAKTGWGPEYTIKETLGDLLQYWRREMDV
ncbi:GDP-mannose 4,6-dehydratase [Natrinema halophilum]|uniref:GDP-mannose 4,6-dehydratase n=1 Tax=Natrinema halophilum TaxID=1699371 RepID=A0A7D5KIU7_9EURY|nr:GDP-mannose 4,6-dehydratase [Natrinema halophilum]QLG48919.1 GDP-mannose 4,6-dehydratase [Natrinema halophilum]